MSFLTSALSFVLAPFIAVGLMIGGAISPTPQEPPLGASEAIPTTIAFFETTLASAITSSATTFSLTSATDADGTVLASSTYAFIIDEGSSNEEIVIADCTGTACINAERGISVRTGNTEVVALKKAHRRGASIKITDAPILMLVARALRGEDVTEFTPISDGSLVNKNYVDSLAFGSTTVAASELDDGFVELATRAEMAAGTAIGASGASLVLQSRYATSSCESAGQHVPITDSVTGKIGSTCLATTTIVALANQEYMIAGETINGATLPVPVLSSTTDDRVYASDANGVARTDFVGFAVSNGTASTSIRVQTGGIVSGFTGLEVGEKYYVSDIIGTISKTAGTNEILVGTAISATQLSIQKGMKFASQVFTATNTASVLVNNIGFKPSKITLYISDVSSAITQHAVCVWSAGTGLVANEFYVDAGGSYLSQNCRAVSNDATPDAMTFSIGSITSTGFTITGTEYGTYAGDGLVAWFAEGY